jgi:ATP-binding cassette, subfamily B, bacterial MsbA
LNPEKKDKRRDDFWRACGYLWPHWRIVAISILCALVVGATFTGGLATVMPIMNVLLNEDTVENWVNRKVVEGRLDVRLADDNGNVRVIKTTSKTQAGLAPGDTLWLPGDTDVRDRIARVTRVLRTISDPAQSSVQVLVDNTRPMDLALAPVPPYLALSRDWAARLPSHPVKTVAIVLGVLIAMAAFGNFVRFFQEYLSEKAAVLSVRDIRLRLYDHALRLPLGFFGQRGTSDVTSRLTQDAHGLQEGMKNILGNSIQEPIKAGMALSAALWASWELTVFIIFFAPLMALLIKKFGKRIRRAARKALQESSMMLGQIEGSLVGLRVVKAANAERYERRRFRGIIDGLMGQQLRIARLEAFNTPVLEMLTLVVVCAIILGASYMVLVPPQRLTQIEFFFVMTCLMGIGDSLRKISKINNVLQKSNAAAARLFELMDMPAERETEQRRAVPATNAATNGKPAADGKPATNARRRTVLAPIQREVRFEAVTFTYPGAKGPAVDGVDLVVPKGKSVAVVGRNGSGKTTLLARFYEPQGGRILIDGVDTRDVTLSSLRKQIGVVTQDSVIFPGTIAQNIAYAMPRVVRDDVVAAAKRAFAHDFILEKPSGYDTVLGEHGAQLSGGQKQRLCIARAILRQTPILILDEATSQVDAESEHLIQQAIESLMHERTTFVIAHRFSTILSADMIVVMDRGQIVGVGTHQELLTECPTYRQLYERQLFAA